MNKELKEIIWNQFGASIDMLNNIVSNCTDEYFFAPKRFYYIVYHSIVFLDYYLTIPPKDFLPLLPFTLQEMENRPTEAIDDVIPDKIYSKKEILEYLSLNHTKCKNPIESLTDEKINEWFIEGDAKGEMDFPILTIMLYNLRHTQHHIGQLNMLIKQNPGIQMPWMSRAKEPIN